MYHSLKEIFWCVEYTDKQNNNYNNNNDDDDDDDDDGDDDDDDDDGHDIILKRLRNMQFIQSFFEILRLNWI